jgi:integrase/recombinase XerD
VRAYAHSLVAAGKKAATVELHAVALRQLGLYLVRLGIVTHGVDDDLGLPSPKTQVYQRGALSKKQARHLVELTGANTLKEKRNQAILALMARAGLRSCEVVRARVQDLQVLQGVNVLWVQGKGRLSPDCFVVLNEKAHQALADYLATRRDLDGAQPLIAPLDAAKSHPLTERQVQRMMTAALQEAGLKGTRITVHSLRHTAASLAIAAGAPLPAVQKMMRHEDPRTTSRYIHLRGRLKRPAENALDF